MILALDAAVRTDIGLIATFGGIGLIVNGLIVYILIQVRGERQQNLDYQASHRRSVPPNQHY